MIVIHIFVQKQPSRGILRKRCSENMQQNYRRTPKPKCDFNKVPIEITFRIGCSPINLLNIFRIPFPKNTSGWLLLFVSNSKRFSTTKLVRIKCKHALMLARRWWCCHHLEENFYDFIPAFITLLKIKLGRIVGQYAPNLTCRWW